VNGKRSSRRGNRKRLRSRKESIRDEELREVAPKRSTGIEIQEFVNEAEISSLYFENRITSNPIKVRARLLLFCEKR
jgi:hypothetical protein